MLSPLPLAKYPLSLACSSLPFSVNAPCVSCGVGMFLRPSFETKRAAGFRSSFAVFFGVPHVVFVGFFVLGRKGCLENARALVVPSSRLEFAKWVVGLSW